MRCRPDCYLLVVDDYEIVLVHFVIMLTDFRLTPKLLGGPLFRLFSSFSKVISTPNQNSRHDIKCTKTICLVRPFHPNKRDVGFFHVIKPRCLRLVRHEPSLRTTAASASSPPRATRVALTPRRGVRVACRVSPHLRRERLSPPPRPPARIKRRRRRRSPPPLWRVLVARALRLLAGQALLRRGACAWAERVRAGATPVRKGQRCGYLRATLAGRRR